MNSEIMQTEKDSVEPVPEGEGDDNEYKYFARPPGGKRVNAGIIHGLGSHNPQWNGHARDKDHHRKHEGDYDTAGPEQGPEYGFV